MIKVFWTCTLPASSSMPKKTVPIAPPPMVEPVGLRVRQFGIAVFKQPHTVTDRLRRLVSP